MRLRHPLLVVIFLQDALAAGSDGASTYAMSGYLLSTSAQASTASDGVSSHASVVASTTLRSSSVTAFSAVSSAVTLSSSAVHSAAASTPGATSSVTDSNSASTATPDYAQGLLSAIDQLATNLLAASPSATGLSALSAFASFYSTLTMTTRSSSSKSAFNSATKSDALSSNLPTPRPVSSTSTATVSLSSVISSSVITPSPVSALIPNASKYTVATSDHMALIANKTGVSLDALEAANPQVIGPDYIVQVGDLLTIPTASVAAPAVASPSQTPSPAVSPLHPSPSVTSTAGPSSPLTPSPSASMPAPPGKPVQYSGPSANFPNPKMWLTWDALTAENLPVLKEQGNSDQENTWIFDALTQFGSQCNVDRRAALAVMMQESTGKVRVIVTYSPGAAVKNTGLMQAHNGAVFDPANPKESIFQMIKDGICGVLGPTGGDGLQQLMQKYKHFFVAARGYNSGEGGIDLANLSNGGGATASYCADLANRLMGVVPF